LQRASSRRRRNCSMLPGSWHPFARRCSSATWPRCSTLRVSGVDDRLPDPDGSHARMGSVGAGREKLIHALWVRRGIRSAIAIAMSALGQKQIFAPQNVRSALPSKADIVCMISRSRARTELSPKRIAYGTAGSFGSANRQRLTASTPPAGLGFKYAVAVRTTITALPVCGQIPSGHVVPIAADQHCIASITVSGLTCGVVNIPCINVMNACIHSYLACPLQRLWWCRRNVSHFPVRMEGGEVQRHIGAEMIHHPGTLRFDFNG
jgi:hypothetical protein